MTRRFPPSLEIPEQLRLLGYALLLLCFLGGCGANHRRVQPFAGLNMTSQAVGDSGARATKQALAGAISNPILNPRKTSDAGDGVRPVSYESKFTIQEQRQGSNPETPQAIVDGKNPEPAAPLPADEPLIQEESSSVTSPSLSLDTGSKAQGEAIPITQVNLNELVLSSLYSHPFIRAEVEKVSQAQADFWTSSLKPNPLLSSSMSLMPLTRPFTVTRQGGPPQFDLGMEFPIDWFLFGKRTAAMSVAHFGVHASEAELQNAIRLRVLESATTYFDALESQLLREVAEKNVENLRRFNDLTRQAVENGVRPEVEGKRISLDLLAAEQDLRIAIARENIASGRLKALTGQADSTVAVAPGEWPEYENITSVPDLFESIAAAEKNRPDLASLRWQIVRANADIDYQIRAGKPTVLPSLGYTRQFQEKAIGFPDANSWGVGLSVSVPVYDRNQGNIAKAEARRRATQFQLEAAELQFEAELRTALAELETALANKQSLESEQLELASEVLRSIETAYQTGGRPLLDVLDAQKNFREINSRAISAKAAYWRAVYRYFAAVGQGYWPESVSE